MKAKDLKQDKHNYRKHSDRNKQLIRKSIEECGYGRSVVIDADGVLIAGNGVASVTDGHTPVKVIETDGSELVVVKRTDLHEGDVRRKKLAMADNATGDRVEWDESVGELEGLGVSLDDWGVNVPRVLKEEEINDLFEQADGQAKDKGLVLMVKVPKEYEDKIEDIRASVLLTLEEWKGCEVK